MWFVLVMDLEEVKFNVIIYMIWNNDKILGMFFFIFSSMGIVGLKVSFYFVDGVVLKRIRDCCFE